MLIIANNLGTISGLNYKNKKWTPLLDLKRKYPKDYRSMWIIGFTDGELIGIMMPRGFEQPTVAMKTKILTTKLQIPLLGLRK